MRKIAIIATFVLLAAALWFGFGRSSRLGADHPLAFIPADTPFVFAQIQPIPKAISDTWARHDGLNEVRDQLRRAIELLEQEVESIEQRQHDSASSAHAEEIAATPGGESSENKAGLPAPEGLRADIRSQVSDAHAMKRLLRWLRAIETEIASLPDVHHLQQRLGLSRRSLYAFYGIGLVPVMRLTLEDPAAFQAMLERLQQNSGESLPTLQLDGMRQGWVVGLADLPLELLVAIVDSHLIITPIPVGSDPGVLRTLLGLERPARSLADAGHLQALEREQGFKPYGSGYFDSARLLAQLQAPATPLEQAFLSALKLDKEEWAANCRLDSIRFAGYFPRLSIGFTQADARIIQVSIRLQTSPDIAKALMQLRAPMPGRQRLSESLLAFGYALNLSSLPLLGREFDEATRKAPWTCAAFEPLNALAPQVRNAFNNPALYAAAPSFSSFLFMLEDFDFDIGSNMLKRLEAQLLFGSENPATLVKLSQQMFPQLKTLELRPDGSPQALPPEMLNFFPGVSLQSGFIAQSEQAIGIAVGPQAKARLARLLVPESLGPVLLFHYHGSLFEKIITLLRSSSDVKALHNDPHFESIISKLEQQYAFFERFLISLELKEQGIELSYQMKFKQ